MPKSTNTVNINRVTFKDARTYSRGNCKFGYLFGCNKQRRSLVDDHDDAPQLVTEAVSEKTFVESQTRFRKTRVSLVKSFF